jgi:phenol 2-monooxygenase
MFYHSAHSHLISAVEQITIAQASIEALFIESLKSQGISVDRPIVPSSLEISQDPKELLDPSSYPVKVLEILIPRRRYY